MGAKAAEKTVANVSRYVEALKRIAALPKTFEGRKGEEEFNDMEDAFTNGAEVGEWETLGRVAAIAKEALNGR